MGLAPILVEEVFRIISDLKSRGVTMLLVEQFAAAALKVADYGYVLENGRISGHGGASKLQDDPAVKAAYLGGGHEAPLWRQPVVCGRLESVGVRNACMQFAPLLTFEGSKGLYSALTSACEHSFKGGSMQQTFFSGLSSIQRRAMRHAATTLLPLTAWCAALPALAITASDQLATYAAASGRAPQSARGREFFTTKHRDVYKYTHDQTVRLINAGYTPREIAEMVKLPASLSDYFGARGYYGDLRHNVKAVYQFYMGFYDGNPANLNPLPPTESAKRYLDLVGGADKAVTAAQAAYDKGDYRWAAELLNHAVLGDPTSQSAKTLLAQTYEQMGYASEAATWRNAYLTGAQELRQGPPATGVSKAAVIDLLLQTPTERFLEAMAASLDDPAAADKNLKINLVLTDQKESYVLWLENAVLHFKRGTAADAHATLLLTKPLFVKMIAGTAGVKDTLLSDELQVKGSKIDLVRFFGLIDKAAGVFPVVTR